MQAPPGPQSSRGMLVIGVITGLIALWISFVQGAWIDAALWYAVAIFAGSFGGLLGNAPERWHRPLVVLGLAAGVLAFGLALRMVSMGRF